MKADLQFWGWPARCGAGLMGLACLVGCGGDGDNMAASEPPLVESAPTLTMDPNGTTPLAGVVSLRTRAPTRATLEVQGAADSWLVAFPDSATTHELPLLGLKPASSYEIRVLLTEDSGALTEVAPVLEVLTPALPADFPVVDVLTSVPALREPGLTLLESTAGASGTDYAMILDADGDVVWYTSAFVRVATFLPNRRIRSLTSTGVLEIDLLGNRVYRQLSGAAGLNHDLYPLPGGGYLSLSSETLQVDAYPVDPRDPTDLRDVQIAHSPIVEFDGEGRLVSQWRLPDLIDRRRIGYNSNNRESANGPYDWAHANAVFHDSRDDSIIVSVRHQDAVVKFSRSTGALRWILGNHSNWTSAYQPYLLSPVALPFSWQFHQHQPTVTPGATLLLMDNGNWRASPFDGQQRQAPSQSYSRAVEYRVDEERMQIEQMWEYGGDRVERLFSGATGGAEWLPETGNVLITFGAVSYVGGIAGVDLGMGEAHARIVEVLHETPATLVFEVAIHDRDPDGGLNVYRSHHVEGLYPFAITRP